VNGSPDIVRRERFRELEHWRIAAERLGDLDALASSVAWSTLEHYTGVALRQALAGSVARLRASAERLEARLRATAPGGEESLRVDFLELRQAFLRTETTLDFYADALATRSHPRMSALLRACDHIATRAMAEGLAPLGRQVPAALTYLDKGLGASILKAGIRLWDPDVENPVAAIKAVRHNLLRPTALLHESGHQVAHALGWNEELAAALRRGLASVGTTLASLWEAWASEIAGDAYAFVHCGYAAVAALRDVVGGSTSAVFLLVPGDPHPVAWLRVLLNVELCRRSFGRGPWDDLEAVWLADHPLERAPADVRPLYAASRKALPTIVEIVVHGAFQAFRGAPLARLLDPARVSRGARLALPGRSTCGPSIRNAWRRRLTQLRRMARPSASSLAFRAAVPRNSSSARSRSRRPWRVALWTRSGSSQAGAAGSGGSCAIRRRPSTSSRASA